MPTSGLVRLLAISAAACTGGVILSQESGVPSNENQAAAAAETSPPIIPERAYVGVLQAMPILINNAMREREDLSLALYDSNDGLLAVDQVPASIERVDLASAFPVVWTIREPRVLRVQLESGTAPIGPPLVLRPLLPPPKASDEYTASLLHALESETPAIAAHLTTLPSTRRAEMRRTVTAVEQAFAQESSVLAGYHVSVDHDLHLQTSLGHLRFRLREEAAPNTTRVIADLAGDGFYDQSPIHRIVARDEDGDPFFIQGGDPTGTGFGTPGFRVPFEFSPLEHRFGTLSLARQPLDPNSGGSQFFISLSREACERFDGQYVVFGELIQGGNVLRQLASVPTTHTVPDDPSSPREKPIVAPVIESATLVPAEPIGTATPAIEPEQASDTER